MIEKQAGARLVLVRSAVLALLCSASPLAVAPAMAQDAPAASQSPPDEAVSANEIVVTATKRAENVQNVPISITAIGNEQLEQNHVSSFDDYARMLPSVSYQSFGPSQSQLYFRGITSGGDGVAVGPLPTVGLYLDETPLTTIYQAVDLHIYDMARVEALSGPQGTLYGASSLSGTLRLITNKPVIGEWKGGIDVQGNKFGNGGFGGSVEGYINVPINDRMALRAMAFYQHDGGYIDNTLANRTYLRSHDDGTGTIVDSPLTVNNARFAKNDFNDVDSAGARAMLRIDLDDNWTITPAVTYQHQVANGTFLFDPRAGDLIVHDFTPERNKDEWYVASATLQGKISDWDITYSGSYFERWVDNTADYSYFVVAYDNLATSDPADYAGYTYLKDALGHDIDPTQTIHTNDKYTKMSHELRINSPSTSRLRLTAGLFYQRQTNRHIADYLVPGVQNAVDAFSPQVSGATPGDVYFTDVRRVDRDYAVFGEGSFDILPNLTLTAGIRGFKAHNTLEGWSGGQGSLLRQAGIANCTVVTVQACPDINKSYEETGETHKVQLKWQVDPTKMVYFTYSTGFRPGGNNRDSFFNGHVQDIPAFRADTLTNYEFGWKTSWANRTLYFNGAVFLEEWHDVQYSLPGILGIFYTLNAGNARSKGVEASLTWQAMHGLTLSASGTYVDAKLTSPFCSQTDGCADVGGTTFAPSGTRLPVTPKFKINAQARYEWKMGTLDSFLQANMMHQSGTTSYLTTDGEATLGPTQGFTTFDFSAGISRDNWTLSAFIINAFDERGILSKNISCAPNICGPYTRLYPTKPRQFGIKAGYTF